MRSRDTTSTTSTTTATTNYVNNTNSNDDTDNNHKQQCYYYHYYYYHHNYDYTRTSLMMVGPLAECGAEHGRARRLSDSLIIYVKG